MNASISNEAATIFERQFDRRPTVVASAPGRVNLVGGHVDYVGGVVLPVAIDRRSAVAARPRVDGRIRAYSSRMQETVEWDPGEEPPTDWSAYVVGVRSALADESGEPLGADCAVAGDVPVGAGLSSSASLEVAVAGAFDAVHGLDYGRTQLAEACWRAERETVGVDCGIMDQFASALARPGHALRLDCRSREFDHVPFDTSRARLLVVDTTVQHELADSGFNDRVRECRAAADRLNAVLDDDVRSLRDVRPETVADVAVDAADTDADDAAADASDADTDALDSLLARRARHVTAEIRRVEAAAAALGDGDVDRVGTLMRESHRSLRTDFDVSCAELDLVVETLDECEGVYGARMTGGGWGGSVVALVQPGEEEAVEAAVAERYRGTTGIDCDVYRVAVDGGLSVRRETSVS